MELKAVIAEKEDKFKLTDVTVIADLVKSQASSPSHGVPDIRGNLNIEAAQLEEKTLHHLLGNIEFDAKVYKNWVRKLKDRQAAQYHQVLKWRMDRARNATRVATTWVNARMKFFASTGCEEL